MVDEERFETCWREERPAMVRAAFLVSGDLEMAGDIVDEVFANVFSRNRRADIDDLRGYLWRSIFHETNRQVRRRRRLRSVANDDLERTSAEGQPTTGDPARAFELRDLIWRAFEDLDGKSRTVLVLRYFADFTNPQIADQLGLPLGTVKSTVHRGLASLRVALEAQRKEGP